jgi:hypothetical protein
LKAKTAGIQTAAPLQWSKLGLRARGLSYADITRATEDALKHAIIEKRPVKQSDISDALAERRGALNQRKAKSKPK